MDLRNPVTLNSFKQEFRPMLRLAGPLALAELGWIAMGIVDTMVVGRTPDSAESLGAVGLGGILFYTVGMFGSGLLLGLDTLVAQAFGAGDIRDCRHSLLNGLFLALALGPVLTAFLWISTPGLRWVGIRAEVLSQAIPYMHAITWSMLPLLLYFALRRYLQGINQVKPVMFTLITANVVNLAGNWVLVFGRLGAPALGAEGSGWATCISRVYMVLVLAAYAWRYEVRAHKGMGWTSLRPDLARIEAILTLGLPAALQLGLEVAVFAAATALIGRLDPAALAGHQIALILVSVTYMVTSGISSAAAVRVGQGIGAGDPASASRSGWAALLLSAVFMSCAALIFLLFPAYVVRAFTPDPEVIRTGASLLMVAAFFQLFDGLQSVATGALRGAGDTKTPMVCHLIGYWGIGLPLGYLLCFRRGWGATGLWAGLCVALILIGTALLAAWRRKMAAIAGAITMPWRGRPAEAD
jgi:MATE family multidrug resistance protein